LEAVVPWGKNIIFVYSENKLKGKLILSKDQNVRLKILAFWGCNVMCNEITDTDFLKQSDVFETSVSVNPVKCNIPED
jgi:hypothetical protein